MLEGSRTHSVERALDVSGRALPCGQDIAEEALEPLLAETFDFFRS